MIKISFNFDSASLYSKFALEFCVLFATSVQIQELIWNLKSNCYWKLQYGLDVVTSLMKSVYNIISGCVCHMRSCHDLILLCFLFRGTSWEVAASPLLISSGPRTSSFLSAWGELLCLQCWLHRGCAVVLCVNFICWDSCSCDELSGAGWCQAHTADQTRLRLQQKTGHLLLYLAHI